MADDQIHPVINVEEEIGKTVGKRKPPRGLTLQGSRKIDSERSRKLAGGVGIPKGVYRFRSHEEADAWKMKEQVTAAIRKN